MGGAVGADVVDGLAHRAGQLFVLVDEVYSSERHRHMGHFFGGTSVRLRATRRACRRTSRTRGP
jgi:hypothetical protein